MKSVNIVRWMQDGSHEISQKTIDANRPYSPDLVHSVCHLSSELKEHLAGTCFNNDDTVNDDIQRFLNDMGVHDLPQSRQKCNRNGDYVEK